MAPPTPVESIDPQREAARAKREHRRERDREHHRESRGSASRPIPRRESSVPHESEYAVSSKHQQRQSNKSRERSRGSNNERPLSQHEMSTAEMMQNLEPYDVLFLSQQQQRQPQTTTPDVALQSQMISHRMQATPASTQHHQHHRSSYQHHAPRHSQVSSVRLSNISSGGSSDLDSRKFINFYSQRYKNFTPL